MFQPIEADHLFTTPLWRITQLPLIQAALPRIASAVEADIHRGLIGAQHNRSNVSGFQSERVPLEHCPYLGASERQELLGAIAWTVRLGPRPRIITWVNCNGAAAFNRAHTHPGAELSGVLYVQVPEGSGPLVFRDPRPQCEMSRLAARLLTPLAGMQSTHVVPPVAGCLLLFPSWLMHQVEPGSNQHDLRIAISLNICGLQDRSGHASPGQAAGSATDS